MWFANGYISVGKVCVGYSESQEYESVENEQQMISGTKTRFWQNKDQTSLSFNEYKTVKLQLNSTCVTYILDSIFWIFETC